MNIVDIAKRIGWDSDEEVTALEWIYNQVGFAMLEVTDKARLTESYAFDSMGLSLSEFRQARLDFVIEVAQQLKDAE